MNSQSAFISDDEADTEALGARVAAVLEPGMVVFLRGSLGAGKTVLVRGLLRALGHSATVKSPTYTLVEPYRTRTLSINHFDLYRLRDPGELEEMGIRDYLGGDAVCLIEWPEHGWPLLSSCDIDISLTPAAVTMTRTITLTAASPVGQRALARLRQSHD